MSMRAGVLCHFSCVWLCNPMDCSLPGSSAHWILQARTLDCIAMPFSRGSSWPGDGAHISSVSCIGGGFCTSSTTWEALRCQHLQFNKDERESRSVTSSSLWPHGLYSPWNSPDQNTRVGNCSLLRESSQPRSPSLQADSLPVEPPGKPKNTGVRSLISSPVDLPDPGIEPGPPAL